MNDLMSKFPALWPKWVQILVAPLVILSLNMLFHFLCGVPFHIKPIVKISGWVCKFGGVYYAITYRVLPYFLITVLKLAFLLAIVWKYRTEFLKIVFSCSIVLDIVALVTFFIDYERVKVKNMSWLFSLSDEYQFSHYLVGNIYLIPAVILLVKVWWWRKMYGKVSDAPHPSASPAF